MQQGMIQSGNDSGSPDKGTLQSEYDALGSVQSGKRHHTELKLVTIVQYMCIGAGLLADIVAINIYTNKWPWCHK